MWITQAARGIGAHLGVVRPVAQPAIAVRPYVRSETRRVTVMSVLAVVLLLIGEAAHSGAASLALLFAPVWALCEYLWRVRDEIPDGSPPELPADASLERATPRQVMLRVPLTGAAIALAVWLIERDELAAWLIPSIGLGTALAQVAGVVQVRRWERRTGRRLLTDRNGARYVRE